MFTTIHITLILLLSQVFTKKCPDYKTVEKFNITKYAGEWYEINRLDNNEIMYDCGRVNIIIDSNLYNVNYLVYDTSINKSINYTAQLKPIDNKPGMYNIYVNDKENNIPLIVLDTDYTNYSIVGGCIVEDEQKFERLFVYSRSTTLNNSTIATMEASLKTLEIEYEKLVKVKQKDEICGRNNCYIIMPNVMFILLVLSVVQLSI